MYGLIGTDRYIVLKVIKVNASRELERIDEFFLVKYFCTVAYADEQVTVFEETSEQVITKVDRFPAFFRKQFVQPHILRFLRKIIDHIVKRYSVICSAICLSCLC